MASPLLLVTVTRSRPGTCLMTFSLSLLCLILLGYLALLYLSAYAVERSWIPRRWVQQPLVYLLSLGVFASAWGYYG
ncbi:hypothetical protein Q4595_25800, partial [Wenyingzhuangia sp. 1_MG-2023]|nr:hypothetical protein [Wenyingzhuangia sp. 1_MG-2023]